MSQNDPRRPDEEGTEFSKDIREVIHGSGAEMFDQVVSIDEEPPNMNAYADDDE